MSTDVKNIIVALRAKIGAGFSKAMKTAKASVGGLTKRAKAAAVGMAKAGVAIGAAGAAAAVAVGYMAKKVIGGMDATGKLADRLGTTTEALTAMRYAADLNGMSTDTLDKSLEGYTRRLGDAINGTGTAKATLDRFGISAAELSKLPLTEQMALLADKIAGLGSQSEKAAAAQELFGRSGLPMLTMLQQGGAAMRSNMKEAEELGLTYNRSTAGAAERVNDNLTRIKSLFVGLGRKTVAGMLPFIEKVSNGLVAIGKVVMPIFQRAFEIVGPIVSTVIDAIKSNFMIFWNVASVVIDSVKSVIDSWGISFSGTGGLIRKIIDGLVAAWQWFAGVIIRVVTFAEACFVNWKDTLTVVFQGALLGLVKFYESTKHWLTVALPQYLSWFGRNWRNVFTDIWNFVSTVVTNMGKNLWGFFKAVWGWLKGEGFDFKWTGLLDGFQATCEELPKIASRVKTDLERGLESNISAALGNIKGYYDKKVTERLKKLGGAGKPSVSTGDENPDQTGNKPNKPTPLGGPGGNKSAAKASDFAILGRGISLSALVSRSAGQSEAKQTAANTKETRDILLRMEKRANQRGGVALVR